MNKRTIACAAVVLAAIPTFVLQHDAAAQSRPSTKAERAAPTQAGELLLFEGFNYGGESYSVDQARTNVRTRWNIRSLAIHPGERWQICARSRFRDPCIVLDRSVHDASLIGVDSQIGSARPAPDGAGDGFNPPAS